MTLTTLVVAETAEGVGTITLSDPKRRNALSAEMMDQLREALDRFAQLKVRVVILGDDPDARVFSAGHNIHELQAGRDPLPYDDPMEKALRAIRSYPGPVIAMVHGSVWGGAFDLVCSCDIVIADETAEFAITPANLGLPYNVSGLLHLLYRLPLNLVKEMFFTAAPIPAEQAKEWHIVNHLVPAAHLRPFTMDMARRIAAKAPLAIAIVKEQLNRLIDEHTLSVQQSERLMALRRAVWESEDLKEGLAAFFEKRSPDFKGL